MLKMSHAQKIHSIETRWFRKRICLARQEKITKYLIENSFDIITKRSVNGKKIPTWTKSHGFILRINMNFNFNDIKMNAYGEHF